MTQSKNNLMGKDSDEELISIMPGEEEFRQRLFEEALQKRVILINDVIDDLLFERATMQIVRFNKEDENIPVEKRKPIILQINSPGGDVIAGLSLINVIQTSETPVWGVCHKAASMAAYILTACHKRYAFDYSVILFHDGQTLIGGTSSKVKDTIAWHDRLDRYLDSIVLDKSIITEEEYEAHRRDEWYMFGDEAKERGVIDYIIGKDIKLKDII